MTRTPSLAALSVVALVASLMLSGCGKKRPQVRIYPVPPDATATSTQPATIEPARIAEDAPVIYTETGLASWYGMPYHNRRAANGEVFDMHQLTAAHKTLPMNSVVRVTNLESRQSVMVRINDRGPFIGDRVIDLSMEAAKRSGVWRAGVAKVKVEVLSAPAPLDRGGRWAVQIGAFSDRDDAEKLKSKLSRKYRTANVIHFVGPTGAWVRFRPLNDERSRAVQVAQETRVSEGGVFLVRLD